MVGSGQSAGLLWRKSKVAEALAGAHFPGAVVGVHLADDVAVFRDSSCTGSGAGDENRLRPR
jgi:hypothetical protein